MPGKRYYIDGDPDTEVTPSQLKRMARWRQREYVLAWFHRNYEDPAMDTPYESKEGGYQYIWGGPYDAREELWREFEGVLSEEEIDDITEEIEADGTEWAPGPHHPNSQREEEDWSDLDDEVEPDFESLLPRLEEGPQPSFGGEVEEGMRADIKASIHALENELAGLKREHGGLGHNNPPADDDAEATAAKLASAILEQTDGIKHELDKASPDTLELARSAGRLQRLGRWLAGKGETVADEFAKAFGKSLGNAAGLAIVAALALPAITALLRSVAHWLSFVTFGF